MNKFIKEELIKFILGLISTTIAILIALLINSEVEKTKDKETFITIIKSVNVEALSNQKISEESFRYNVNRIIYREFSYKLSEDFLGNKIFLTNASDSLINDMNEYILCLKRANVFRSANEKYKYDPVLDKRWGDTLRMAFTTVLENCDTSINRLIRHTNLITKEN
jgi:hypothetical protein